MKQYFIYIYPSTEIGKIKVVIFINKKIPERFWTIKIWLPEFITVRLEIVFPLNRLPQGYSLPMRRPTPKYICVHNIYLAPYTEFTTEDLMLLSRAIQYFNQQTTNPEHITAGNFNLHYPLWGDNRVKADADADMLLEMVNQFALYLLIKKGTKTWNGNDSSSTIDLVWDTADICRNLIAYKIAKDYNFGSDHFSIETTVKFKLVNKPFRFRKT